MGLIHISVASSAEPKILKLLIKKKKNLWGHAKIRMLSVKRKMRRKVCANLCEIKIIDGACGEMKSCR